MITRKSKYEISLMKVAGSIVATVLNELKDVVKPGITTAELDDIAEKIIRKNNAVPTFKGYHGFPGSICASVNHEVVHGIPNKNVVLKDGDVISIDIGATYKGMIGDAAITVGVGNINEKLMTLQDVTDKALYAAIDKIFPGKYLEDVSGAIEDMANQYGFGIVKQYGGHGVGRNMHEDPFVYNYRTGEKGPLLKPGMVIAIEPMFNLGVSDVHVLEDGWTVVTDDGLASAHFEHTVLICDEGHKILTVI